LPLNGCKILVVEDEYLIAEDLAALLRDARADVIGPAESLPQAMRLAADTELIDAAVLDINLRGVTVFPLADELTSRAIPIMFLTGYGENNIPEEYGEIVCCEKPMGVTHIVDQLKAILNPTTAAA
jgi:DNA-binding response OmpR family regulator